MRLIKHYQEKWEEADVTKDKLEIDNCGWAQENSMLRGKVVELETKRGCQER